MVRSREDGDGIEKREQKQKRREETKKNKKNTNNKIIHRNIQIVYKRDADKHNSK